MSHQAVARVTMRMLHDPDFAAAVSSGAQTPVDLTDQEVMWVRAVDVRAWGVDPLRPRRVLRALVDEFKGSALLVLSTTRKVASLDAFFQSAAFHGAVQTRGSLADGFAAYLAGFDCPQLPGVLALELGLARARRELDSLPPRLQRGVKGPWRACAPGVRPLRLDGAALATLNALESWLFQDQLLPGLSLVDDAPRLPALPDPMPQAPVWLVAHPTDGVVRLSDHGRLVYDVLSSLDAPCPLAKARRDVVRRGVPPAQADSLLGDLVAAGLVLSGAGR